jgi:enoyl-CoA hydratase
MSQGSPLLVEEGDDGVVLVTLNRPDTLNAADEELHGAVTAVWRDVAKLPTARAVVLTGAGKAFSAGGDLTLLQRMTEDLTLRDRVMAEAAELVHVLADFPLPIVAAVNGPAVGLGCSLASLSDLVVMEDGAFFADPHVVLGLVAGDGGALTWPFALGIQRAKELLLLGGRVTADDALRYGLANRVVRAGQAVAEARRLAQRLAALPPQALRETRRVLNQPLVARVESELSGLLAAETASFDEPAFRANLAGALDRQRK